MSEARNLRGRVYECLRCAGGLSPYLAEKRRVVGHILKYHLSLDEVPCYCRVCLFRCQTESELMLHTSSYPEHHRKLQQLQREGRTINLSDILVINPDPYLVGETDMRSKSKEESAEIFRKRSRTISPPVTDIMGTAAERVGIIQEVSQRASPCPEPLTVPWLSPCPVPPRVSPCPVPPRASPCPAPLRASPCPTTETIQQTSALLCPVRMTVQRASPCPAPPRASPCPAPKTLQQTSAPLCPAPMTVQKASPCPAPPRASPCPAPKTLQQTSASLCPEPLTVQRASPGPEPLTIPWLSPCPRLETLQQISGLTGPEATEAENILPGLLQLEPETSEPPASGSNYYSSTCISSSSSSSSDSVEIAPLLETLNKSTESVSAAVDRVAQALLEQSRSFMALTVSIQGLVSCMKEQREVDRKQSERQSASESRQPERRTEGKRVHGSERCERRETDRNNSSKRDRSKEHHERPEKRRREEKRVVGERKR